MLLKSGFMRGLTGSLALCCSLATQAHAEESRPAGPPEKLLPPERSASEGERGGFDPLRDEIRWSESGEDKPYWRRNFFKRVVTDQWFFVRHWVPAEVQRPSVFSPFLAAGVMAAASDGRADGIDQQLLGRMRVRGGFGDGVTLRLSQLGEGGTAAIFLGGGYLLSRWRGNNRMARATSLSSEALLTAGIWSVILKPLTRRTRPSADGTGEFFATEVGPDQSTRSFPSGHAMGAFAVATVFADEYRDKKWVRWVAYGGAGLIAWSRVARGRHFPSDVVFGALLGNSFGRMVAARDRGLEPGRRGKLDVIYDPLGEIHGLSYTKRW